MNGLSFDLSLKEVPVTLANADGTTQEFILREMTGKQRDSYMNKLGQQIKMVNGQAAGLKSYDGLHSNLLTEVLFDKETDKAASKDFIQQLPARVTAALFAEAQKMNGLSQTPKLDEEIKND